MKITQTINLGGFVFHIDEDAYRMLQDYLAQLKKELRHEQGVDEIMNDIEVRIAELLREKLTNHKEVITDEDIMSIKLIMGDPAEINEPGTTSNNNNGKKKRKYRRMYRDPEESILGGVCSGVSAYIDLDPTITRVVFIVLAIFGGSGLILYLIFWIILPEAKTAAQRLEMRGEPITINNIKDFVNREYQNVKQSFK